MATEISQKPGCNTRVVQGILGHKRPETTVGYKRADSEIMKEVVRERFDMIDVRPKVKDDIAATAPPAGKTENRKENKNPNLKPTFTLSPEIYVFVNRKVDHLIS
ncbi:hypothetical protein SAMN00808754_0799 [Thermanaeromonas toyohensis ToBE]|uniref:Phage integrase family protein n=1 Tax=Thermanaeromonas toyohensis ToBE TaxID=698762 RepID=A0A1W1VIF2_9FIRM|nr:hypothetical protein SAMN00808754_0799 [Thermanaeromonas toyohensis ToBE]